MDIRRAGASGTTVVGLALALMGSPALTGTARPGPQAADVAEVAAAPSAPPAVTLLFSRSQLGTAKDCVADRTPGTVWLDTTVAPELHRRGLRPTGSLETGGVRETDRACMHYRRTLGMSWADAARYRDDLGWTFVSHSDSRVDLTTVERAAVEQAASGSLDDLVRHGHLRARGMFAYPNDRYDERTQAIIERYYDFGRTYRYPVDASVNKAGARDAGRLQWTSPAGGGRCAEPVAACRDDVHTSVRYKDPAVHVAAIQALGPGDWLSIQSYVFVTGRRDGQWDCTAADARLHWTSDVERYCWGDYVRILDALSARPDVTVADPWTVAGLWWPNADRTAPGVAPDLVAEITERARVRLTWGHAQDDRGVAKYRVYRDGALLGASDTRTYADSTADDDVEHTYQVSAVDAAGNIGPRSAPAIARWR